jgi:hypothetical protein
MDLNKIKEVQSYLEKIAFKENLKYKIIIVRNAYFFFLDEKSIKTFYKDEHESIKGWYTGVLSFSMIEPNLLYVFISEILYNNVDAKNLFLRILHQTIIYLNPSISKLKIKKFRRKLKSYLLNIFQNENLFTEKDIDDFLNDKKDLQLFNEAEILIPHLSFYSLIEKLSFKNDLVYLENAISYLKPFEYINLKTQAHEEHKHHFH